MRTSATCWLEGCKDAYATIVQSFFNEVLINLHMFSIIILNLIVSDANSYLIIA